MFEACMMTLWRSALVALGAAATGVLVCEVLVWARGRQVNRLAWIGVLLPLLTPAIVAGYVYSQLALSLVHNPKLNVFAYCLVMLCRVMPVAVLILHFGPGPMVSREALHCAAMVERGSYVKRFRLWVRGPVVLKLVAYAATFLLVFAEFEIASLMGIDSWTVWLFDSQAGGVVIEESIRHAILPMLAVLVVVGPTGIMLLRSKGNECDERHEKKVYLPAVWCGWLLLTGAMLLVSVYPSWVILQQAASSGLEWAMVKRLLGPIGVSLGYATVGATISFAIASVLLQWSTDGHHKKRMGISSLLVAVSVPGLFGSLLVGLLVMLGASALPFAHDSVWPLVIALVLVLMPLAVLLRLLLTGKGRWSASFLAGMLQDAKSKDLRHAGGRLVWRIKVQPQVWMGFLLFLMAYFDISSSAILTPAGQTPVSVLLYNLMHYGQNTVLAAMVAMVILAAAGMLVFSQGFGKVMAQAGLIHG